MKKLTDLKISTSQIENSKDKGFSLVEVIIALALLALGLSWISNLFTQQRLNSIKNESVTGAVSVSQVILDDLRQRLIGEDRPNKPESQQPFLPKYQPNTTNAPYVQVCTKDTTAAQDPRALCPGGDIADANVRQATAKQLLGEYYKVTLKFCPYDADPNNEYPKSKKCTNSSRYIRLEIEDIRRAGAENDKYVNETAFTNLRLPPEEL